MAAVIDALRQGTVAVGRASAVARFAVELRTDQDPVATAAVVAEGLAELDAAVSPLSALEPGVLVVELPGRTFDGVAPAAVFSAAYTLADGFGAVTAEPDLPTAFFPEEEPRAPTEESEPVQESLGPIPGCNVAPEPALAADWALATIRAREAWEFSDAAGRPARGAGIIVAQPDTGVIVHRELEGVERAGAFDTLNNDPDPTDPLTGQNPGHGTGTASVVVSPMSLTLIGSSPGARHMPIRAIDSVVRITQVTVARAIDWAVQNGAHVITMSLGGIPAFSLHRSLRRAVAADVIVLAAAGNCVRQVVWPARYDDCIAVAGINSVDAQWPGSCRGAAVDISAPAQNVWRAASSGGVEQGQGTSFAVALTAGVAALWLAHHGRANLIAAARARGETLQQMFLRLARATARRPDDWDPFEMGAGIVDAHALLGADLDLDRDRESVAPVQDPDTAAARSVESLIAEAVSPEAAVADGLDLHRFGPELAGTILSRAVAAGGIVEESVGGSAVSPQLAAAVGNPGLTHWLGVDGEGVPE